MTSQLTKMGGFREVTPSAQNDLFKGVRIKRRSVSDAASGDFIQGVSDYGAPSDDTVTLPGIMMLSSLDRETTYKFMHWTYCEEGENGTRTTKFSNDPKDFIYKPVPYSSATAWYLPHTETDPPHSIIVVKALLADSQQYIDDSLLIETDNTSSPDTLHLSAKNSITMNVMFKHWRIYKYGGEGPYDCTERYASEIDVSKDQSVYIIAVYESGISLWPNQDWRQWVEQERWPIHRPERSRFLEIIETVANLGKAEKQFLRDALDSNETALQNLLDKLGKKG